MLINLLHKPNSILRSLIISSKMSTIVQPKVFVTRGDMPESGISLLKEKCDVACWPEIVTVPREYLLKHIAGKDALFCCLTDKIDAELLDAAGPNLKVIATMSVGYDHIDVDECKRRGIKLGYTCDVLTDATAELTLALLLCTSRRLIEAQREAQQGGWTSPWAPRYLVGPGISGATVGIVGLGRIGQAVVERVKGFKPSKIIYFNRSKKPDAEDKYGIVKATFEQLLQQSDFVICCSALTQDTKLMFNKKAFETMKPSAIFINTSRGGLVDQEALVEALEKKEILAAGLDVTTPEPLPLDNPLLKLPNCLVVPHIGSATSEARSTMSLLTARNILAALSGTTMPAELTI